MEFKKALLYPIEITASENSGYLVKIGCAMYVFTDKGHLASFITEYITNPEEIRKAYYNNRGNQPREEMPEQPTVGLHW